MWLATSKTRIPYLNILGKYPDNTAYPDNNNTQIFTALP